MARGRQADAWDHTAAILAHVAAPWSSESIDPARLNPYRRAKINRTPARRERENRLGWRMLDAGLGQLAKASR